ncbi:camphor resistance protein CrcB [Corynebacterium yudongzhengii]|uniref:Fluoride-specific ion channel FluC n=1 Tax=Corynebacterium yudongzhengii TaxID=2080740 RepID=A0A2U1T8P5_9CORY|nr:CrcB family protein [Corynebacterium yudongzhengii]AWB82568.1 camphor resistance protein CrcB [Corynebacterium yudongzhengii]PWC02376.1 CrcB family protein [Corynebacterium yudongzhengii]
MTELMCSLLLVAAGGFLGGIARWGLTKALPDRVAIFTANAVGSLIFGIGLGAPGQLPLLVAVGVGGALSTWSTFANQLAGLVEKRRWAIFARYLALTVAVCVVAAWRGTVWAGRIFGQWP